jgi:hypothetical protein
MACRSSEGRVKKLALALLGSCSPGSPERGMVDSSTNSVLLYSSVEVSDAVDWSGEFALLWLSGGIDLDMAWCSGRRSFVSRTVTEDGILERSVNMGKFLLLHVPGNVS